MKLCIDKFEGSKCKHEKKIFFKFHPKLKEKQKSLVRALKLLGLFWTKLCNLVNSRVLISNMIIIYKAYSSLKLLKQRPSQCRI